MLKLFKWWFKIKGWKIECELPQNLKKCIIVAAPHTSNWDFVYSMAGLRLMNIEVKYLAKEELFWWPLKSLLVNSGGIAVERKKKTNLVDSIINLYQKEDELFLMLSPEGTRKNVERWRSGFYYVATSLNIPVILAFLDYKHKIAGVGPVFYLTGDKEKDMEFIRNFYKDKNPKNPDFFHPDSIKL